MADNADSNPKKVAPKTAATGAAATEPATFAPASAEPTSAQPAKARFGRALDEARAGADQLRQEAQERAGVYREKAVAAGNEWYDEAKVKGGQARERALELANEGKTRASEAIFSLGKIVDENATLIEEKIGPKYGEYARSAAQSMQDAARKLDAKDMNELGEDAKELVRKSPGVAVGIAAVAGFMLARMFRRSDG